MQENIAAVTEPGPSYPAYLSLNVRAGRLVLTAREDVDNGGATVNVQISKESMREFCEQALKNLDKVPG